MIRRARPLIAVVDDEESVRRALTRLLRASRLDVETFASGQEFLDSLKTQVPACLVLDMQMEGLTGRDVQHELARRALPLPVVIVTAHDDPGTREHCIADGAIAYLRKPLCGERLLEAIHDAVNNAGRIPPYVRPQA